MSFSVIATAAGGGGGPDGHTTSSVDTTGSDLIVIAVAYNTNTFAPTVSDSKGNSWTGLTEADGTGGDNPPSLRFFYSAFPTVGSGHTFTASGSSSFPGISVIAVSGSSSLPFDVEAVNGGTGTTSTIQPGSITPTHDNYLVLTALSLDHSGANSVNQSFTLGDLSVYNSGQSYGCVLAYLIQTTATARNPTWTPFANSAMSSVIASFRPLLIASDSFSSSTAAASSFSGLRVAAGPVAVAAMASSSFSCVRVARASVTTTAWASSATANMDPSVSPLSSAAAASSVFSATKIIFASVSSTAVATSQERLPEDFEVFVSTSVSAVASSVFSFSVGGLMPDSGNRRRPDTGQDDRGRVESITQDRSRMEGAEGMRGRSDPAPSDRTRPDGGDSSRRRP